MTDGARRRPGRADHYTYLLRLVLPLAAVLTYAGAAGAAEATAAVPSNPYDGPSAGLVAAVEDGQTLTLADGRRVRLANILAPLDGEPFAAEARKRLTGLALDRQIRWSYAGRRMDRYGRLLAYVYDTAAADGAPTLQADLVAAGLARVMGQPDTPRWPRRIAGAGRRGSPEAAASGPAAPTACDPPTPISGRS
jgi:endonuclease YncB( thermonuclease family)